MLYVTTRSNVDAYTANRALCEDRAPDRGLYVPFKMPLFSPEEINALADRSFGQRVADILNLLFGCKLTSWDVDFCVGRYPVRLVPLSHRIVIGECWHNPEWDFTWTVRKLCQHIRPQVPPDGDWAFLAVRIAVLFGIFGELIKKDDLPIDIAVPSSDLSGAMAARYAREWGLPIGNIVVCCNENTALWDLLRRRELRTNLPAVKTTTPDCDQVLPRDLERLIFACGGISEVTRYLNACRIGGLYCPSEKTHAALCQGLHISVVGTDRIESAIPNVYRTHSYLCGPYTALCYSGLLDHRSRIGERRRALVLSERSPLRDAKTVASALRIPEERLDSYLK